MISRVDIIHKLQPGGGRMGKMCPSQRGKCVIQNDELSNYFEKCKSAYMYVYTCMLACMLISSPTA